MGMLGLLVPGVGMGGGQAAELTVWAKTGTYRYHRTQAAGSGTTASLTMAGNETRSIQVLARATGTVANFDIAVAALSDGRGNTIAASNLHVQRGHQIQVVQNSWTNGGDTDGVEDLGWYPDALIPTVHPVSGDAIAAGATYQALPYSLPADQTHTFLIDVTVPAGTVAGTYTGTVTVSATGQSDVEISVTVNAWGWALPTTSAFTFYMGAPASQLHFYSTAPNDLLEWSLSNDEWNDVVGVCNTIWQAHGLAANSPVLFGGSPFILTGSEESWSMTEAAITQMRTHIDTYHPAFIQIRSPRSETVIDPYNSDYVDAYLDTYAVSIAGVGRSDTIFGMIIGPDEPYFEAESIIVNEWGKNVVDQPTIVSWETAPPELLSITYNPALDHLSMIGAIDTWAISIKFYEELQRTAAQERIAAGESIWFYTSLSGDGFSDKRPYWALDRDILNYRVMPWVCWHEDAVGSIYWGAGLRVWPILQAGLDYWTEPVSHRSDASDGGTVTATNGSKDIVGTAGSAFDGGTLDKYIGIDDAEGNWHICRIDAIADSTHLTITENWEGAGVESNLPFYERYYNAEGVFVYPCSLAEVGYYGIVSTMRFKSLRDGIQDYGYFALAEQYGASADAQVNALIRDVVAYGRGGATGDGDWDWEEEASAYDTAIAALGSMIAVGPRTEPGAVRRVSVSDGTVGRVASTDTVIARVTQSNDVVLRV